MWQLSAESGVDFVYNMSRGPIHEANIQKKMFFSSKIIILFVMFTSRKIFFFKCFFSLGFLQEKIFFFNLSNKIYLSGTKKPP